MSNRYPPPPADKEGTSESLLKASATVLGPAGAPIVEFLNRREGSAYRERMHAFDQRIGRAVTDIEDLLRAIDKRPAFLSTIVAAFDLAKKEDDEDYLHYLCNVVVNSYHDQNLETVTQKILFNIISKYTAVHFNLLKRIHSEQNTQYVKTGEYIDNHTVLTQCAKELY